jgi:hypothetical protein
MKYKHNHPSQDLAIALGIDKKAENRLNNAISKAYHEAVPVNGTVAFDDFIAIVAPYIKTAEEGFYAAITMHAEIEAAKHQYYSKGN